MSKSWFDYMIRLNRWFWFHTLAGVVLFLILTTMFRIDAFGAIWTIFIFAIFWELLEYLKIKDHLSTIYENLKHFVLDAIGDILGATGGAIIIHLIIKFMSF